MAKILSIVTHPDPILREKSRPLDKKQILSDDFKKLCADMALTMKEEDGIGLAAPQIGQNIRLIVVNTDDGPLCMINPVIKKRSMLMEWGEEGCLSIPGVFGEVKRHRWIRCQFINLEGRTVSIKARKLLARVIQHEIDHLDGILFIDKAKNITTEQKK